jgi:hypothetical protein
MISVSTTELFRVPEAKRNTHSSTTAERDDAHSRAKGEKNKQMQHTLLLNRVVL